MTGRNKFPTSVGHWCWPPASPPASKGATHWYRGYAAEEATGPEHFERLKVFLLGQSDAPYAALAREMNTSEGALKVAIHRLRKRYRDLFRQEIADTVADPAQLESELRFLAAALTRK